MGPEPHRLPRLRSGCPSTGPPYQPTRWPAILPRCSASLRRSGGPGMAVGGSWQEGAPHVW